LYSEVTGIGPYEGARVQVRPDGRVTVATAVGSQGQGHRTTLTQIVADELGVSAEQVDVTTGDTANYAWGIGTFASRSAVTAGNAARLASRCVVDLAKRWAGERLEVSPEDLELAEGTVRVRGVSEHGLSLAAIASGANPARGRILEDWVRFRPGLEAD